MRLHRTLPLLLLAMASLRAEAPSIQGTLPEDYLPSLRPLLKTAVERSPNTIMASIQLAQGEAVRYLDAAQLWPQVSGGANYAVSVESVSHGVGSTERGFFYNFGVNQSIFQWGAYKNNAVIGTLGVKIAERSYAEAYRLLATTIREQYMGLVTRKIALRNARFSQKIASEAVATLKAKLESGSASEADLQGVTIAFQQAELNGDRSAEDYAYAKRVFTRLVGIDDVDEDSVPLELGHPEYSASLTDAILTGFLADGVESTFQSEVYKMQVQQQDLAYSIAKVRLLPKINASANYQLFNQSTANSGFVSQVALQQENYSIAAYWSVFDGLATRGAKLSALANKRLFERIRKTYIDNTIDSISYMRHQIALSSRAMALSEVHNALIGAEVKRITEDLKLGYASPATVEQSTMNLYLTEVDVANARTDYFSRWSEFISLAGIDPAIANVSPRYVR
ncbi:MAG TPA: TolC family protein [Opitutaceae bacterium]|nr:TolC family protein [Opitutaceae bacterium]